MDMVLSGAKIIGNGPCRGVYNGMVDAEIERQKQLHRKQLEDVIIAGRLTEDGRGRMTEKAMEYLDWQMRPPVGRAARVAARITDVWCVAWAWLLEAGLIEEVEDGDHGNHGRVPVLRSAAGHRDRG